MKHNFRKEQPIFTRHEGEWEGTYIHQDPEGNIIDQHHAHLIVKIDENADLPYNQTNIYTWDDGKKVDYNFSGSYRDNKINFDVDRLVGHSWETEDSTIILTWKYNDDPASTYYEMININDDSNERARIWHCFTDGKLVKRVLINEKRIK